MQQTESWVLHSRSPFRLKYRPNLLGQFLIILEKSTIYISQNTYKLI